MSKVKAKKLDDIQKVTLSISETKEMIKHQFRQTLLLGPKYSGLMYFIISNPGVGKTQLQGQILEEMMNEVREDLSEQLKETEDFKYFMKEQNGKGLLITQNLCAKDAQDLTGLPILNMKDKTQSHAQPDSIPKNGYGIIFYDEANRVHDLDMKSSLLSLWMDRSINSHKIGDGYIQVAAGNPFEDERFETEKPDQALSERFRIIELVPTVDEVIEFLEKKYESHFLLSYFKENKDMCNLVGDYEASFSPRLIDKAMEITFSMKETPLKNEKLTKTILSTYFGHSYSLKIMNFLKDNKELSFEKIVKNVSLVKNIKKTDMPLMTKLSEEIFDYVSESFTKKKELTPNEKEAMSAIAKKLNAESMAIILNKIASDDNSENLFDFFKKENEDFMRTLHKVTDIF